MPARSVVVVGSGFGGLSTACYLADAGFDVTVLEKNEQLGGHPEEGIEDVRGVAHPLRQQSRREVERPTVRRWMDLLRESWPESTIW